jgi:hypothetical protein
MQLPAVAVPYASQPANKQWRHVLQPALCWAVLCVAVPHSTSSRAVKLLSSPDTRASHGPMSAVAEVGWCLCDTYQMAMIACLCNDDASNLPSIYGVFSLSVLNYSAKFRCQNTCAVVKSVSLTGTDFSRGVILCAHVSFRHPRALSSFLCVLLCVAIRFNLLAPKFYI